MIVVLQRRLFRTRPDDAAENVRSDKSADTPIMRFKFPETMAE
ncbi:hypothetical protein [Ferrovibrio sp.]|nr:hypothetical protein [Ferrovibrio sp.]